MIFTEDLKDEIFHCVRNDIIWHHPGMDSMGLTCKGALCIYNNGRDRKCTIAQFDAGGE